MFTTIAAIGGLVLGIINLVLNVITYRRDRPKLLVSLRWDAIKVCDQLGRQATFGQIYLTNAGRQPIYVTCAGIEYDPPHASWYRRTERQGTIKGRKLAEGDPPLSLVIEATQAGRKMLGERHAYWREFRAFAETNEGKRYVSPKTTVRPSWGTGDGTVPKNFFDAGCILECDLEQHELESYLIKDDWVLVSLDEMQEREALLWKHGISVSESETKPDTRRVTFIGRTGRPSCVPPG